MSTQLTQAEMNELIALRAEKARRDAEAQAKGLGISIGQKSNAVVLALDVGGWPVTLYKDAWLEVAAKLPQVLEFIAKNDSILPKRPQKTKA
jgi:hypothetical protein